MPCSLEESLWEMSAKVAAKTPPMNVDQVLSGDAKRSALSVEARGRLCHYFSVWPKLNCAPNYSVSHGVMVLNTIQIHVLPSHEEVTLNLTFDWILNAINNPFISCEDAPWMPHNFLFKEFRPPVWPLASTISDPRQPQCFPVCDILMWT